MSKEFMKWRMKSPGFPKLEDAFAAGRALGRREIKGEGLCDCLHWLLMPLRKAIKDQNAAWFGDHKNPPSNIKIEWVTGIDSAQMLLTEIKRLDTIEAIPEEV